MKKAVITVNETKRIRPIKPLNGVNNGPLSLYDGQKFTFDASGIFQEAEIPYVRLHDTEFPYGSELFVDYECIFPNFDADVNDPANYYFEETDRFIGAIAAVCAKVIYRLGVSIENENIRVKRFIGAPRDFAKFAEICVHIIAHYTEGWKRGFFYQGFLWEIWNEPNGTKDMWTSGNEAYAELYAVTAKRIRERFPNELVGGPAVSYMTGRYWPNCPKLLDALKEKLLSDPSIPMDFFSFHNYAYEPEDVAENAEIARKFLVDTGHEDAIIVMDEYNYVPDWNGADLYDLLLTQRAAAFLAANFASMQNSFVDMACYYTAQLMRLTYPEGGRRITVEGKYRSGWNGIYKEENGRLVKLPGFGAFLAFKNLRALGTQIEACVEGDARVYALAAANETDAGAYFVNFSDEEVEITFRGTNEILAPFAIVSKNWKL